MANSLYNSMMKKQQANSPFAQIMRDAQNFKNSFRGNPRDEVQKLLNSGQLSQADFNRYSQIAQKMMQMMGDN